MCWLRESFLNLVFPDMKCTLAMTCLTVHELEKHTRFVISTVLSKLKNFSRLQADTHIAEVVVF